MRSGGKAVGPKLAPFLRDAARATTPGQQHALGVRFARTLLPRSTSRRVLEESQVPEAHLTTLGQLLRRYAEELPKKGHTFELPHAPERERGPDGAGSGSGAGSGRCSGWESDPQSFSRVIAKHHVRTETGRSLEVKGVRRVSSTAWRVDFPGGVAVYVTLSRVPDLVAAARWYPKPAGQTRYYGYSCAPDGQVTFRERGRP
jgi:hypothetical protein